MPTSIEHVAKLYNDIWEYEDSRLATHPMEREITLRAIRKRTAGAQPPLKVADIGGGPGKFAFALADEGHHVDLVDLSPELIKLVQTEQDHRKGASSGSLLRSLQVGNALEEQQHLEKGSYDVVLLLGPLYHLMDESERAQAVTNAMRLAKPGGFVFVAFISIAAHLRDIAVRSPGKILEQKAFYEKYLQDGKYEKTVVETGAHVQSFHSHPNAVRAFFNKYFPDELELVELRSQEGILGGGLDATLAKSEDGLVQAWADLMFEKYSTDEEYLGSADHLLAVLRRR